MRNATAGAILAILVAAGFGAGYLVGSGAQGTMTSSVSTSTLTYTTTSTSTVAVPFAAVNETIFIHVINSTSGQPIANEPVTAGPASSATDITFTLDNSWTINECVHGPGEAAVGYNTTVTVVNGTTTTYARTLVAVNRTTTTFTRIFVDINGTLTETYAGTGCHLKNYDTNATGWVTISNQNATYFFIQAGTDAPVGVIPNANAQVVAIEGSQTYVTAPIPEGNFTVSSTG